jgi:CheY-like chemotaxis protein
MTSDPASVRVLIASDSISDGRQVNSLLEPHFKRVKVSSNDRTQVQDFETFMPDILVLAFDTIEKAQHYYLGLYRFGHSIALHRHRAILLCRKEDLSTAFDLCKKRFFDDYVLYWPYASDGNRLPMCVWVTARELLGTSSEVQQKSSLLSHAHKVQELEETLSRELGICSQNVAAADGCLSQLEKDLTSATDALSQRLAQDARHGTLETSEANALAQELSCLKNQQLAQTRLVRTRGFGPLADWARQAKRQIEPALSGARELAERVQQARSLVMVIDDDEITQEVIARAIDAERFEALGVLDGAEALRALQHVYPDVILMDIQLPGIDGVSLTRRLKSAGYLAEIPIIMLTGSAGRETVMKSIEAGAADFLAKPFTRELLRAKLQNVSRRACGLRAPQQVAESAGIEGI